MTHNHVARAKHGAVRTETHVHGLLDEAQSRIAELRAEAMTKSRALLDQAKGRGTELLDQAQERGGRALKSSKTWISENPGQAVGIAFVAGVIAHAWFRRGGDES